MSEWIEFGSSLKQYFSFCVKLLGSLMWVEIPK